MERILPIPELLSESPYKVTGSTEHARTDVVNNTMEVPVDDSPNSRYTRIHELAHVKWTPPLTPEAWAKRVGTRADLMQIAEDARINMLTALAGVENRRKAPYPSTDAHNLARYVAGWPWSQAWTNPRWAKIDALVRPLIDAAGPPNKSTFTPRLARSLETLIPTMLPEDRTIYVRHASPETVGLAHTWGAMTIRTDLPMQWAPTAIRSRKRKRHARTTTGWIPSQTHRIFTDGKIFQRKSWLPSLGGTVLVDLSGSMCLSVEQIMALLAKRPSATIAGYNGTGPEGWLYMLARKMQAVNEPSAIAEILQHKGNIVDGPALRWLAEQEEPRIWVSDGGITGIQDFGASEAMVDETKSIRRVARIKRLDTIDAVLEAFTPAKDAPSPWLHYGPRPHFEPTFTELTDS